MKMKVKAKVKVNRIKKNKNQKDNKKMNRKSKILKKLRRRRRKRNNPNNSMKPLRKLRLLLKNMRNNYIFNKFSVEKKLIMNQYKNLERCLSNMREYKMKEKDWQNLKIDSKH